MGVRQFLLSLFNEGELYLCIDSGNDAQVVGLGKAIRCWPVETIGLSRADALIWLEDYCGW